MELKLHREFTGKSWFDEGVSAYRREHLVQTPPCATEGSLQVSLEEPRREEAQALLGAEMPTNSSRASTEMQPKFYREPARESWLSEGVSWLLVTPSAVVASGVMLKRGIHASGANYILAARVQSQDKGYPEHLADTTRKANISIKGGGGQQKQTQSLPLQNLEELPSDDDEPWVKGGPTGTFDTLTAGSWWPSRELEVAASNRPDVTIFDDLKQVETKLGCSKNGSRATGQGRAHVFDSNKSNPTPKDRHLLPKDEILMLFF